MNLYQLTAGGVLNTETGEMPYRNNGVENCERWMNRNQRVNNVTLSAGELAWVGPGLLHDRSFNSAAWHSCEALDYLRFIVDHPVAKIIEVSSKRNGYWNGKTVAFNKAKTAFHEVLCEPKHIRVDAGGGLYASELVRQGFAPQMLCQPLELTAEEREEVLAAWRHGKAEWYREHANLPLRDRAENAKKIAIANPS